MIKIPFSSSEKFIIDTWDLKTLCIRIIYWFELHLNVFKSEKI